MDKLPVHIALIPDGNRRWARQHNRPIFAGHQRGFKRVREISKKARQLGIKIFTAWAFSTENWKRTKQEVNHLMNIYEYWITETLREAIEDEVRIIHIGRKDRLRESLNKAIENAEKKTKKFSKYYYVIALDYGGRDSVVRGLNKFLASVEKSGKADEKKITQILETSVLPQPEPDLIIRTSGEQRLSGFLPWESVYSELIFVPQHLPDFTIENFEECLREYARRKRRFGE